MNFNRQSLKKIIAKAYCFSGLLHFRLQRLKNNVLILMYHKVDSFDDPVGLSVPPDVFRQQILTLKKYFDVISLDEIVVRLSANSCERPAVAITFDDGYVDNYENVLPIIQEYNIPISIFLATGYIYQSPLYWEKINAVVLNRQLLNIDLLKWGGAVYLLNNEVQRLEALKKISALIKDKPREQAEQIISYLVGLDGRGDTYPLSQMMTWDQVRLMQKSGLVTFGSHTVNHYILSRMSKSAMKNELIESRLHIEAELGVSPDYLAYPNGEIDDFNEDIENTAAQVGYKLAFTTISGSTKGNSLYSLPRIDVTMKMSCDCNDQFIPELFLSKIIGVF